MPAGLLAQIACLLEVRAPKAGNVHPGQAFADATYRDYLKSARAIAPVLDRAPSRPLGETILNAVRATRRVTRTNTNLGIILLLSPLAKAHRALAAAPAVLGFRPAVRTVLGRTTIRDAELAYRAIRLANPGGLGKVKKGDVRGRPGGNLTAMMALAARRDLVARQYRNGFREAIAGTLVMAAAQAGGETLDQAIVRCHLSFLSLHGDSLIARKAGLKVSREAARRAKAVLAAGWPRARGAAAFARFDGWLRADGNRRNPGATADLVAASLFLMLASGMMTISILELPRADNGHGKI
jgi:triphosphoribosyl-dephospho-CoA synthase